MRSMSVDSVATANDTNLPSASPQVTNQDPHDENPAPDWTPSANDNSQSSDSSGDDLIENQGIEGLTTLPSTTPYASVPGYVNTPVTADDVPQIGMEWTQLPYAVPVIFPDNPANQQGQSDGAPPVVPELAVNFAAVRGIEQQIVGYLSNFVTQYRQLVSDTAAATGNPGFFGQNAQAVVYYDPDPDSATPGIVWNGGGDSLNSNPNSYGGMGNTMPGTYIVPDVRIQNLAQQFALGPAETDGQAPLTGVGGGGSVGMETAMQTTLTSLAGAAEAVGQYVAAIAKALDAYAYADEQSAVPPYATLQEEQQQG
jgi:hypothetical protein